MEYLLQPEQRAVRPEARRPVQVETPSLPGDVGFWTFIAADAVLFALLFFQFSFDRSSHAAAFDAGQHTLPVHLGAANTLVLVTSSWLLALAVRSAHRGNLSAARRLIAGTVALGLVFAAVKTSEYAIAVGSGHTISAGTFFMYYFVITGIHLLHLVMGVIAVIIIGIRMGGDRDPQRERRILECGASYWHLIDLLWMFIFPLLYLAR